MDLVDRVTNYLQTEAKLSDRDSSVVKYGLQVLRNTVVTVTAIAVVGRLLDVMDFALYAMLTASVFRVLSGGAHSDNLFNCTMLGVIVSPGIGLLSKYIWPFLPNSLTVITFLSVALVTFPAIWKYAPADTPTKPITKPKQIRNLKTLSFVFFWAWCLINSLTIIQIIKIPNAYLFAINLGVLWQSFSLTPYGYATIRFIDERLSLFSKS